MRSTKSFISAYKTAPELVHHKSLMSTLPSINSDFQKGKQQCVAEFFQEFCRELGYKSTEARTLIRCLQTSISLVKCFINNIILPRNMNQKVVKHTLCQLRLFLVLKVLGAAYSTVYPGI